MAKKNEDPTKSYQEWTAENTEPGNTPVQTHDNNYQAVGAGSSQNAQTEQMKPEDQAMLKAAGEAWGNAATQEERDAAHKWAESIRNKYGYSGGQDGSDRLDVVTGNKLDDSINNDSVNNGVKPSYADDYANNGAADKYGVGNNYAKEVVDGMTPTDYNKLTKYGEDYNMYAAQMEQALAKATTEEEKTQVRELYQPYLDFCHQNAEAIRNKYGYSGGDDGSQYIQNGSGGLGGGQSGQTVIPSGGSDLSGLKELPDATKIPDAPDFTGLLDEWLSNAQKQQEAQIDYATQQGITQLERAEQDAQRQFQTQRDQVSANEAKALDNQALYAERRGDKGGIGAVQYAAVQNAAMEQRRAVNQAQIKLSTDTARQIADLRSQGEFEKADALLDLTQTYLSRLMEVQQWNAEYSMQKAQVEESIRQWEAGYQLDVSQFEESIRQWQVSFQESVRQWEMEYQENLRRWEAEFGLSEGSLTGSYKGSATLDSQKLNTGTMAEAGWTMLQSGIMPSFSQLQAMGMSSAQAQEYLAALKQSQSVTGSKPVSKPKDDGGVKVDRSTLAKLFEEMYTTEISDFSDAEYYLLKAGVTSQTDRENWANDYITKLRSGELKTKHEQSVYGAEYEKALSHAMERRRKGESFQTIRDALATIYPLELLTDAGLTQIMEALKGY